MAEKQAQMVSGKIRNGKLPVHDLIAIVSLNRVVSFHR